MELVDVINDGGVIAVLVFFLIFFIRKQRENERKLDDCETDREQIKVDAARLEERVIYLEKKIGLETP